MSEQTPREVRGSELKPCDRLGAARAPSTISEVVDLGDVELATWVTPGEGDTIVLLHAAVGHGDTWPAQHAAFGAAGLHVVSWSRRGHRGSTFGDAADPPPAAHDLVRLLDHLDLGPVHLVGTGLGGFHAIDAALTLGTRVASLTVSSSLCGLTDPPWEQTNTRLLPPAWHRLPDEVRELGPAYRAADPDGVERWLRATDGHERRVEQRAAHAMTFALLATITPPTLVLTGDADPYLPPPRMREVAAAIPRARSTVVRDAGHSPAWERPAVWNKAVLAHVAASSASRRGASGRRVLRRVTARRAPR